MRRLIVVTMLIGTLVVPPVAAASPGTGHGFAGFYTAVDCATWWQENQDGSHDVDCDVWGDGSTMTLSIGRGARPRVVFVDYYATVCARAGLSTVFTGVGYGVFDTPTDLLVTLSEIRCGTVSMGFVVEMPLYRDAGSQTLWSDPDGDGWGTVWYRAY